MPGIFISHASADKELVDEFVDRIVNLGCGVPEELIFYSSGSGSRVPSGMDLNSYVRDRVRDAELVVALVTPTFQTRQFCIAELGAAWARTNNLFPLNPPGTSHDELEGVLKGVVAHSLNDSEALDELHDRICVAAGCPSNTATWTNHKKRWLRSVDGLVAGLPAPRRRASRGVTSDNGDGAGAIALNGGGANLWGQLFDTFVDAAFCTADQAVSRDAILKAAAAGTLVPGRYLYSSDSGADNWIRLCEDPGYLHHRETVDFWAGSSGREMADLIRDQVGRDFDYVSLGAGDGKKDAELVSTWIESEADIFYYPYDISLPLLSQANTAVRKMVPDGSRDRLHVKAVLADFKQLGTISEVFRHRGSPNVVALLGNSLGNLTNELGFLRELRSLMTPEDLLVLEVRLQTTAEALPELATSKAMRFDFGPLEHYLGLTFDRDKMSAAQVRRISSIGGTRTTLVSCKDVSYRGELYDEIKLIYIHEYDHDAFVSAVQKLGFELLKATPGDDDAGFLVCVLRPTGAARKPRRTANRAAARR